MDKHDLALHHAMKALILIQDELGERLDIEAASTAGTKTNNEGGPYQFKDQQTCDRFNVLICALHNIAVEHEFLKQYVIALNYYQKSRDLSARVLGIHNPMTMKMDKVFHDAAQKIQRTMER